MTRIISILNHKGGVGKTTTTANLGASLSRLGERVLLVDMDPQSNLSQHFSIESPERNVYHSLCEGESLPVWSIRERLDVVPADLDLADAPLRLQRDVNGFFKLRECLEEVRENYDYILIDCPPSLEILTANALIASNEAMVVVQAHYFAAKGLSSVFNLIDSLQQNLNRDLDISGILLTQLDKRTVFTRGIAQMVGELYEKYAFDTVVRYNISLAESTSAGKDIFEYAPKSAGAEDYEALGKEVKHGKKVRV
ncbi:hypothetical protein FUAX_50040 (plasmid) [Fulvitalea axinellae]|uniref:AAA domain-containing protein n=1 Tax=Fulvitalea axinellae TaxID=1182444 RepID=A0AAU9D073_9BACT|nr:hypothetical protein FUAX_50040 [Fulvitalea axinellae]